jgi:type II secretory pathway predicted ATPase ExeA
MYLEHFGLNEPPFRITPHTDFFFAGANRGATLDALVYAITHDEGIVKVSGEVGSGKTMLCRVLMERLPENVIIIYLANPSLSRDDILFAIADELRLNVPESARSSAVMRALQDHLIKSYGEGRQVVVLIDEAHAMPVETLEEIRLLSNLEANRNKLLQLVLFGQPELNEILARPDMRQLKERITHNFGLAPLVHDDVSHYIDFRMRAAGYRGPNVFSATALKLIAQNSLGLTRRINILADKSLLAAFSAGSHEIGPKEIQAAIRDCEFSAATYRGRGTRTTRIRWIAGLLILGALAVIAWLSGPWRAESGAGAPSLAATVPGTPAAEAKPRSVAGSAPAPSPVARSPAGATAPQAPAVTPPAAATAPPTSPTAIANADAAVAEPTVQAARPKLGPLTLARLNAGHTWLEQLPDDHWFIQVFATDAARHGEVETLLRKLAPNDAELDNIHVYYSELSGKPRYGVTYGSYSTRAAASAALHTLPKPLQANRPYPRQVVRLR